jgi:hypothetical protein
MGVLSWPGFLRGLLGFLAPNTIKEVINRSVIFSMGIVGKYILELAITLV